MPGMSGLELLPRVKSQRPDVPMIMITAYGDAETKRKALEHGAEALLTKPIDFDGLAQRNRFAGRKRRMTHRSSWSMMSRTWKLLIQQKFRHQIRDGTVAFPVRPRRRRGIGRT